MTATSSVFTVYGLCKKKQKKEIRIGNLFCKIGLLLDGIFGASTTWTETGGSNTFEIFPMTFATIGTPDVYPIRVIDAQNLVGDMKVGLLNL